MIVSDNVTVNSTSSFTVVTDGSSPAGVPSTVPSFGVKVYAGKS